MSDCSDISASVASACSSIEKTVERLVGEITTEAVSRAYRAAKQMTNQSKLVLRGTRSGKVYRKPNTHGRRPSKATKELMKDYGHKLRGGQLYRASAPGEPPAVRTGAFRNSWKEMVFSSADGDTTQITAAISSDIKTPNGEVLGELLEQGSSGGRLAPRPFKQSILEKAQPGIERIFRRRFLD